MKSAHVIPANREVLCAPVAGTAFDLVFVGFVLATLLYTGIAFYLWRRFKRGLHGHEA